MREVWRRSLGFQVEGIAGLGREGRTGTGWDRCRVCLLLLMFVESTGAMLLYS